MLRSKARCTMYNFTWAIITQARSQVILRNVGSCKSRRRVFQHIQLPPTHIAKRTYGHMSLQLTLHTRKRFTTIRHFFDSAGPPPLPLPPPHPLPPPPPPSSSTSFSLPSSNVFAPGSSNKCVSPFITSISPAPPGDVFFDVFEMTEEACRWHLCAIIRGDAPS